MEHMVLDKSPGLVAIDEYECVHHHLELVNVIGDGNCFWRALYHQIDHPHTGRGWRVLKEKVMWILEHSNGQLGFAPSVSWDLLCYQQAMEDAWASELSISAASFLLRRPLVVLSDHRLVVFNPSNADRTLTPVTLWCSGQHFQSVHRVSTSMGDSIASVAGMWRGGGRKAAAKRERKQDNVVLPPGDLDVDLSDGTMRVVATTEMVDKCKEELPEKTGASDNEVDVLSVIRRRRELPGVSGSSAAFAKLFEECESTFATSLKDVQKHNPDSSGCIRNRVDELYSIVDDTFPLLKDTDPRLRRTVVCLLTCYKLRITDYVILEQVSGLHTLTPLFIISQQGRIPYQTYS